MAKKPKPGAACSNCDKPLKRGDVEYCSKKCWTAGVENITNVKARFERGFTVARSECWIWNKSKNKQGYGYFFLKKRRERAHRAAWEIYMGSDPGKMHVCHKCDNTSCVNPAHLFLGDNRANMQDKKEKGRSLRMVKTRKGLFWEDGPLDNFLLDEDF